MDEKNDSRWLAEILRIEREQPFAQRTPDDYFEYNGENYPCRNIFFRNEGVSYVIATERLEKVLLPDGETYVSEAARAIDEQILFFVPDAMLSQPEEAIESYVSEAL